PCQLLHSFPTRRSSDLGEGRRRNRQQLAGVGYRFVYDGRADHSEFLDQRYRELERALYGFARRGSAARHDQLSLIPEIDLPVVEDRKSTRLNSSHRTIS